MKKKIGLILLIVLAVGAVWWIIKRKSIIKNGIQSTVLSKTDSLYKLTYDSSYFDEVNGNATLYNVALTVDSAVLAKIIARDTVPSVILNIHVKSINIQGLKSLQLLAGSSIDVDKIALESPQIIIDKLAPPPKEKKVNNDSTQLYKTLLGHFDHIHAKTIEVNHAKFTYNNNWQNQAISLADASVTILDFKIDRQHDYNQLLDYFIKNTNVGVKKFMLADNSGKILLGIDSLNYDSYNGKLFVHGIQQQKQTVSLFAFSGLNTSDFIRKRLFNSRNLTIENVALDIEQQPSANKKEDSLSLTVNDILKAVKVDTLELKNASLSVKNSGKQTIEMTGVKAMVPHVGFDSVAIPLKKFIAGKEIDFSIKQAFISPIIGLHQVQFLNIIYKGKAKYLTVDKVHLAPRYSKEMAMKVKGYPTDLFYVDARNVRVTNCNLFDVFLNKVTAASSIDATMDFTVYEDKTLFNPIASRPTDYPQKKIGEAAAIINIPLINFHHSTIAYEEKSAKTKLVSRVAFFDVDAQIRNVHNRQNMNQPMLVDVNSKFLNAGNFTTHWSLPYGTQNFDINGKIGPMDLTTVNPIAKSMAAIEVQKGQLDGFSFQVKGSTTFAHGSVVAQYHDVKMAVLKKDKETGDWEKKGLASFIGNLMLHKTNKNPTPKEYDYTPKVGDSFFGTAWQAIFTGLKKIAM